MFLPLEPKPSFAFSYEEVLPRVSFEIVCFEIEHESDGTIRRSMGTVLRSLPSCDQRH